MFECSAGTKLPGDQRSVLFWLLLLLFNHHHHPLHLSFEQPRKYSKSTYMHTVHRYRYIRKARAQQCITLHGRLKPRRHVEYFCRLFSFPFSLPNTGRTTCKHSAPKMIPPHCIKWSSSSQHYRHIAQTESNQTPSSRGFGLSSQPL